MNKQITSDDLVIVTGFSGAGISSVLKTLEDQGYEVFDNFPLSLIKPLIDDQSKDKNRKPIAVGLDTRTRGFSPEAVLKTKEELSAKLVFITCDESTLLKRFTETRRRHPLAKDQPASFGIMQEKDLLRSIQDQAQLMIDTTDLSVHDLRHILEGHFKVSDRQVLMITLMSFGFKNGTPREADIIMDVRFLRNPHWDPILKPQTGKDKAVGDYVSQDEGFDEFISNFKALIEPLLARYLNEGKKYLTIAIGCTGGRHRSVFSVETLAKWLSDNGHQAHIDHRDLKD